MKSFLKKFSLLLFFVWAIYAQDQPAEQTGMMNSKIKQYSDLLSLDTATISSNCEEVNNQYHKAIEAYDFLSTFTLEVMQETLQNIGKLRTLGDDLEQEATATFEQLALRDQLSETRTEHRLEELQWRVNWSSNAKSSELPVEEINAMKEEITTISGGKQQELDDLIQQKTDEQGQLTEQIQLGESSYNKLNADKQDLKASITVLNDKLQDNKNEMNETLEANSTREEQLAMLQLKLQFFEDKKKVANSFDSIKQLSQLSMKTEEEINQINDGIESANSKVAMLQESSAKLNDHLITKKAEMREVELQMETVNTQLLQIKHQSEEVTNFIQETKQQQTTLLSQVIQKDNTNEIQKNISKLEQTLSINQAKLSYLNQKILSKQDQMKQSQKESQKKSLELELTQLQKEMTDLESQTEAVKVELKFQKQMSEHQTSFLELAQEINPQNALLDSEKELKRAQEKVQEGKDRIERLEREEQMYQDSSNKAQKEIINVNAKLASTTGAMKKEQLEDELKRLNNQYQRAWSNYVEKKEELVKEKQLLVTFENFETSLESDKLKEKEEIIENKKEEQEQREEQIQNEANELENKLKIKEQQKGEACAIRVGTESQTEETTHFVTEMDEGPIVIPSPPKIIIPTGTKPTIPTIPSSTSSVPVVPTIPSISNPDKPATADKKISVDKTEVQTEDKVSVVPSTVKAPTNQAYPVAGQSTQKVVTQTTTLSPAALKQLDKAEESERRGKVVNEIEELIRKYEELITIKETYLEEQLKVVVEKEEIVIKRETEIIEASEQIKQQVQKCKKEKRQIIVNAKQEKESLRSRQAERDAKNKLAQINKQLKEEFLKEGELFKKKKVVEEKENKMKEKQAELDKKVEEIEKKIFKDVPAPKQQELIRVDVGGMHAPPAPQSPFSQVTGSKIPLAYPWIGDHYIAKKEDVVPEPKVVQELAIEEVKVEEQEKKAEEQKEAVKQEEEAVKEDEKTVELKQYQIEQKEKELQQKSVEVQQQLESLDQEIARCKLIFSSGDEQTQDYQMCQWQSNDYDVKKQQLETMKEEYLKQLTDFTKEKEQFYSKEANNLMNSFVEVSVNFGSGQQQLQMSEDFQKHFDNLVQLTNTNKKELSKSLRHTDGMVYLLQSANKLSEDLKTVLLSIPDNREQVRETLKQVLGEIDKLYETAIVQRNLKQGQNIILEKKRTLMKLQSACIEAQRILQQ